MRDIISGSIVGRGITRAADWIDAQWSESTVVQAFLREPHGKRAAESSLFTKAFNIIHSVQCRIFKAVRLDRALSGSLFANPFFWCLLAAALAPLTPTVVSIALTAVSFGSLFLDFGRDRERRLIYSPINTWIWIYALIYTVSTLTSVTLSGSLKGGLLTVMFMLFAIVLQNSVRTEKQLDTLIYMMVTAGTLVAAYGVYQYVFGVAGSEKWVDKDMFDAISVRVYSTLENPNVLAEYLLLIIPLTASCIFTTKTPFGKTLSVLALFGMLLCMLLTYSRGGWLGLIIAAAVFLVLIDRRFIFLGILAFIGVILVLPSSIIERFTSIGNLADGSTSYRISIWLGTVNMLKNYWFCGIGPGTAAYTSIYPAYAYNAVSAPHSHSLYLQVICECGICGLVVLMGVVFSFFRSTSLVLSKTTDKKVRLQLIAVISGMAGFLFQGATDYSFYNYRVTLMFWIIIAVGVLLSGRWKEKEENPI